ncbi:type II secretion system F family protein [Vibrio amylolyticus]|uniref:type II secretion system F family protein n=1 Tax=Vibrio amylolyticus TaxID=2847292 RepID=UPI003552B677
MLIIIATLALLLALGLLDFRLNQKQFQRRKQRFLGTTFIASPLSETWLKAGLTVGQFFEDRLLSEKDQQQLKTLLLRAGFFKNTAMPLFLLAKFGLIIIGLVLASSLFAINPESLSGQNLVISFALIFSTGIGVEKWVEWRGEQRQSTISRYCPDMMDMMVICTESGAGLDVSLAKVASKLNSICPELAEELHLVVDELTVLPDRSQAFRNLANRTLVEELKIMATTLNQAMNYGSSIAKTLRVIAADTRQKRLLTMEEAAAKVPAKMGGPLIILVLFPTLMLIAAPALLNLIAALS